MARLSARSAVVAVVVVIIVVLLFRGAGHWLVDTVATLHGHGGPR
jgi:hypothetical protein